MLQDLMIILTADFPVDNAVIRKEPDIWLNLFLDVVYVKRKKGWTNDWALGDARCYVSPGRLRSIYHYGLFSVSKDWHQPVLRVACNDVILMFATESLVWNSVKCLLEVEKDNIILAAFLKECRPFIDYRSKLSSSWKALSEAVLGVWDNVVGNN